MCPTCSRALRASCLTCSYASCTSSPTYSRALRASCLRALAPHVSRAQGALVPYLPRVLRVLVLCALRALVSHVS